MGIEDLIRPELEPMRPYAPGLRGSELRERLGDGKPILKLSSNEHPRGPVPAAVRAMNAVASRVNRYPDGSCRALKKRIAQHWDVGEEFVAVGNGSNELLRLIGQAVTAPGDEIVYAWPSFVVYPMVCNMFGAKAVAVPLTDDKVHDVDAMLDAITERTKVLFLCNPNNPTGTIYGKDAFARVLDRVPDHVLTVVDEAYFEFATSRDYPDGLAAFDGERPLIVARTFSKMYSLAGLRVGYAFMPPALVAAVDKLREPFNVNMLAQVAAFYSLDDHHEVERRRAENQEQKTYLYSAFDRLGVRYAPSEANFVYFTTQRPVGDVFDELLTEGVISRVVGTDAIRLTLGTPEDNALVVEAFERVVDRLGGI